MQIIDFSSTAHATPSSTRKTLTLEIITATLIFVVPALVLFILTK